MENSYFAPGQFVIETKYPDWENIKHVMIRSFVETTDYDDRTQNTCDINNISLGFYDFTLKKLQENNIPIEEINAVHSWYIDYKPHGYQKVHNHTNEESLISTVMYFAESDGSLVTLLGHPNTEVQHIEIKPAPGKLVILNGNVNHLTYPSANDRSVWVINFKAKWKADDTSN